ncbi:hypothetical protein J1N44_17040 [Acidovorax temperans]|uniref:hypothetical protein n=1 Tax=Acidovorax temperans TaxID=80878 RepID=UPI001A953E9D|nr:hypothetical protein [Acidovorax temperans]MBO0943366.1 hypothetical protein [Acidovorax temperans]
MTTYNTGNPVGSAAAKDLYDNAENLDVAINSPSADVWTDRLGQARKTWRGIQNEAQLEIAQVVGEVTAQSQQYLDASIVARDEARAAASASGPIAFFGTYAAAQAAVGGLPDGGIVEVSQDETRAGARTRYKVQAGALVFLVNLDQTKIDLAAASGAGMVGYLPGGVGAVATNVQAKLRERVSVTDFGANTAAFQAAYDAVSDGGIIEVPPGASAIGVVSGSAGKVVTWDVYADTDANLSLLNLPGIVRSLHGPARMTWQGASSSTDYALERIDRTANHAGGTPGGVASTLRVNTTVSAGVSNFEWGIVGVMTNNAMAGENVAGYFKGVKNAAGPTFGSVSEVRETTDVAANGGAVGIEVDVFANGSNNAGNRVGIDIVGGKNDGTGATARIGYGIRVGPQNNDSTRATFGLGMQFRGTYGSIIDTQGATIEAGGLALRMKSGQSIGFATDNDRNMSYVVGVGLGYFVGASEKVRFTDAGDLELPGGGLLRLTSKIRTTSATAGAASALPTAPDGYISFTVDGVSKKFPYYAS